MWQDMTSYYDVLKRFTPFATSYALLLVVPGANFAIVAQATLAASRRASWSAVFGVATGASLLATAAAVGASLIGQQNVTREGATIFLALYLCWTGLGIVGRPLRAREQQDESAALNFKYFGQG